MKVFHETTYRYSDPVFLEPHTIRLRPRSDPSQRELSYGLTLDPTPSHLSYFLDCEGNSVARAHFQELTHKLVISSEFEVVTLRQNPFDFLWNDDAERLGFRYSEARSLDRFLAVDGKPTDLTQAALRQAQGSTLSFLTALN